MLRRLLLYAFIAAGLYYGYQAYLGYIDTVKSAADQTSDYQKTVTNAQKKKSESNVQKALERRKSATEDIKSSEGKDD